MTPQNTPELPFRLEPESEPGKVLEVDVDCGCVLLGTAYQHPPGGESTTLSRAEAVRYIAALTLAVEQAAGEIDISIRVLPLAELITTIPAEWSPQQLRDAVLAQVGDSITVMIEGEKAMLSIWLDPEPEERETTTEAES